MIAVHIGFPKAGSTTVQTYLGENQNALRELSVDYPRPGRDGRAHHRLAHELTGRIHRIYPEDLGLAELARYLSYAPFNTTIISSECFAACNESMISRLGSVLSQSNQTIRILQVIRPLVELAVSSYAQRTRYGGLTYDFDEFLKLFIRREKFDAFRVAHQWAGVFGWEAMRISVLDPQQLLNGDLIDNLLAALDLNPDDAELRSLPRRPRANESTGWRALEAIRDLFGEQSSIDWSHPLAKRVVDAGDSRDRKKDIGLAAEEIAAEIGWSQNRGRYLTRDQAERLHGEYRAAIDRLNQRLPVKLSEPVDIDAQGFVERGFLPSVNHIPPAELHEFHDAIAQRLEQMDRRRSRE